ncbi:hypothetical protein PHMEG_0006316 [Phytophthora megakarya]|uniref:Helitron helicase-like domain-containing protein n=1 Tax=Phytophthora megakarya TaxID=4795 RepID=A0A225WQT2_9STRA|nr:hypothetical protein PHMEG_0006316 [Phytophthora megakarya]
MLSSKGILSNNESGTLKLRLCSECYDAIRKKLPKFAIRNGFYIVTTVAESVFEFDETVTSGDETCIDCDQSRVGAEDDLDFENEHELTERSVIFVKQTGGGLDGYDAVTEIHTDAPERPFLVRISSIFSRDTDGNIYAKMFPHFSPYGRGHPGEPREIAVSQEACIKYYSMHSSRRFAEDETFLLVAFDRLSIQRMFTQVSLTCQRYPELFRGYESITHEQLARTLRKNGLRQQGRLARNNVDCTPAGKFLRSVEIGAGSVWGSNLERQRCRREAFTYQKMFGQPARFLTLTPNVSNSFAIAQYTASARVLMGHLDAFIEDVLAIDKNTGKAKSHSGLFGPVKAYYGMVETQGGRTLHAHFIIWLMNCPINSDVFEALLISEPSFRQNVAEYSSSIVSNTLPLSVDGHCCLKCKASYCYLEPMPIPSSAFNDPKKLKQPEGSLLVRCSACQFEFTSRSILRGILMEERPSVWTQPRAELTTREVNALANVESVCGVSVSSAARVIRQ